MKAVSSYNKKIVSLFKFILVPLTRGVVFYKLFYAYKIDELVEDKSIHINVTGALIFLLVFILMFANWCIETWKWKILVQKNEPFSFYESFKAVTAGVTLSIITPNQLGDFAGRIIYLKTTDKVKGVLVAVIGHTAQVIMTLAFGAIGFLSILSYKKYVHGSIIFSSALAIVALIPFAVYWFVNLKALSGLRFHKSIKKYADVFAKYNSNELIMLLVLSFMRYAVFVLQYYLLTVAFNVNITPAEAMVCITSTLFIQSFVPSFILIELGMRGVTALFVFGFYTNLVIPILLTTYMIWIINILLPGLAGMMYLLKWRSKVAG